MTYREYMIDHDTESLSWCAPYEDKTGDYRLVMYDGEVSSIATPSCVAYTYNGTLTDELLEAFARDVNPDYECYQGYTDLEIAMEALHPVGCAHCPHFDECETMGEEMGPCDYR